MRYYDSMQNLTVIKFFIKDALSQFLPMLINMAERSKALVQNTNFFCDVGSNPTAADSFSFSFVVLIRALKRGKLNYLRVT